MLVSTEVALACSLLVCSALLIRTVREMTETPTGVAAEEVLTTSVQLTREKASDGEVTAAWRKLADDHTRILDQIRRQPGVAAAGGSNFLPLEVGWRNPFGVEGQPPPARPEDAPQTQMHSVSEGYFEAMGARLSAGRPFAAGDGPDVPGVLIVNETFARRYLPAGAGVGRVVRIYTHGIGPLGRNLRATAPITHEGLPFAVVGVVADVRDAPLGQAVEPAIYFSSRSSRSRRCTRRARGRPTTALAAVRKAIHDVAPTVPIGETKTGASASPPRPPRRGCW